MLETNNIEIVSAEQNDIYLIADLHKKYINKGFLNLLGIKFLILLYHNLIIFNKGILFTVKKDNRILGFISGVTNVKKFYKYFLQTNFFRLFVLIIFKLFNMKIIKGVFEILFYPQKSTKIKTPDAELLSIVVDKEYQGKGIAKILLNKLVTEFKNKKIENFKVIVGAELKRAVNFYEKAGFIKFSDIEVHKGIKSYVYVYKIK